MVVWRNKGIVLAELWFDEELGPVAVDIIRYCRRPALIGKAEYEESATILIDLTQDLETIFNSFKKGCRYEIRRAMERDNLTYLTMAGDDAKALGRFCEFYEAFAEGKGLATPGPIRMKRLGASGMLDFSEIRASDGTTLVWHSHIKVRGRARLLQSASLLRESADSEYRAMIGRANRFHHWQDMVRLKAEGISVYDLGGWYPGMDDRQKLGINKFKEGFGGRIVREYNFQRAVSLKGRVALTMRRLLE